MVFLVDETKGLTLSELLPNRTSICQYLQHVDLYHLERYVTENCYKTGGEHAIYDPLIMLKLVIVKFFRQLSYRDTLQTLTDQDCRYLGLPWTADGYIIPARSTLHHFVKYRLKEEGVERLMEIVGTLVCKASRETAGIMDSTPVEASRYDKNAEFNVHYQCKMYKAHIFHLGDVPLFCQFSEGNESDSTYAIDLIKGVARMDPNIPEVFADAGYDAFQIHADIHHFLHAKPFIQCRDTAVVQEEGTEVRIDHWVNKMWKMGGSLTATLRQKLEFLYSNGRQQQVGMYLRNQNVADSQFSEVYAKREDCERTHNHIKSIMKLDVRRVRNESKRLYVLANFVVYQILLLGHLQNNISPVQQLAHYY
jgi:hypothetical protein